MSAEACADTEECGGSNPQIYERENYILSSSQEVISRNASLRRLETEQTSDAAMTVLRSAHLTSVLEGNLGRRVSHRGPKSSLRHGSRGTNRSESEERQRSPRRLSQVCNDSGPSNTGLPPRPSRDQIFSQAEQRIIETGLEVAEQKTKLLAMERNLASQQEAQSDSCEKLQQEFYKKSRNYKPAKK